MADAVLFLLNLNFRGECEFIHVTILLRKIDCSFIWCNFHFSFSFCFWNFPYNFITMLITPCWPIWCHVLLAQVLIQVLTVLLVYCLHKQGMRLLLGCVCLWHWKASMGRTVNTTWSIQTSTCQLKELHPCATDTDPGVRLPSFSSSVMVLFI